MSEELTYGYKRTVDGSPDEVEAKARDALADEGFGILTEIDVKETLKKKLDVDFRPYKILGACNPPLAHRALSEETDIGLLLPCNVIVYEGDEPGTSVLAAMDAVQQLGVTGRADMEELAAEVNARLKRALDTV
jgi:uncharacterized protein (DUF302 family)